MKIFMVKYHYSYNKLHLYVVTIVFLVNSSFYSFPQKNNSYVDFYATCRFKVYSQYFYFYFLFSKINILFDINISINFIYYFVHIN